MDKLQVALSIISGRVRWDDLTFYHIEVLELGNYDRDKVAVLERCEKIIYDSIYRRSSTTW